MKEVILSLLMQTRAMLGWDPTLPPTLHKTSQATVVHI